MADFASILVSFITFLMSYGAELLVSLLFPEEE